jgi:cystathionine gamma-lyase
LSIHHAIGCEPDGVNNVIVPPISLGTTFVQSYPGKKPGIDDPNSYGTGYFYSRQANPTRGAFERALAQIEHGKFACAFSSGLAACHAVANLLNSGDEVLALNDIYGGTISLFKDVMTGSNGISFNFIDMSDPAVLEAAITPKSKMIWIESPTNPLLRSMDIEAIAKIAKKHNLLLVVDGTFLSPYLQNPLLLGADVVIHSVTKFIAGHSDVLMGVAVTRDENIIKRLRVVQEKVGAVPSPFECYLALRGLKTLHLRVEAAQANAMKIAKFLEKHPMISKVLYPGLESYPQYELAKRQSRGPGAMISFYVKGGLPAAGRFLQELKVIALAVSLGAVESLACSPALMTHAGVPRETRLQIGLSDDLVRFAVGVEDADDLIADLDQALRSAQSMIEN